jgi:peptidoglycan glycosyltransferase
MAASGERNTNGKLLLPTSQRVDLGRMSIGQDKLAVTPLQMAMVAAAVANQGKLMVPHLTNRVVNQDGQTVETIKPSVYSQVMKASSASELATMMTHVVDEGTGTPARLPGVSVAGKTGTAQIGVVGSNLTQPWFIGFAPVGNPKVAVAVTIDKTQGLFGGQVAAPIAAAIIKSLLSGGQ